jgi:hypothetical protein
MTGWEKINIAAAILSVSLIVFAACVLAYGNSHSKPLELIRAENGLHTGWVRVSPKLVHFVINGEIIDPPDGYHFELVKDGEK